MNLQFAYDVPPVSGDSVDGDEQVVGNLLVGHTLDETDDDFLLAFGDGFRSIHVLYQARDAGRNIVVLQLLFQDTDGGHEDYLLDIAMVGEPFFVVINVVERGCQLVVDESVVRQIFDDDVLQFMEFTCSVAMVLREDVGIVVVFLFSAQEGFDVWEEGLFLVFHVKPDIVGILIVESKDEESSPVLCTRGGYLAQRFFEFLANGRQLEVEEIAVRGAEVVEERLDGNPVVGRLGCVSIDKEVDDGKESVAIDSLLIAYLADSLVAEARIVSFFSSCFYVIPTAKLRFFPCRCNPY